MNKSSILFIGVLLVFLIVLYGCINVNVETGGEEVSGEKGNAIKEEAKSPILPSGEDKVESKESNKEEKNAGIEKGDFSEGINKLLIELLEKYEEENKNIIFSPYNIYEVTGMLYYASDGKTKEEFEKYLLYYEGFKYDLKEFKSNIKSNEYVFNTANGIWISKDFPLKQSYKNEVENYFEAKIENADFSSPENVRNEINSWVQENTGGKIKNMFPVGSIEPYTKIVLVGTTYFNGNWEKQFNEKETTDIKFYGPYKERFVKMMSKREDLMYYENQDFQAVSIPYKGKKLELLVVLPKGEENNYRMRETLMYIKENGLREIFSKQELRMVSLKLPKFKISFQEDIKEFFIKMGVESPFRGSPDFSKMTNSGVSITTALHKAYIEVNERGTEAAASTGFVGITSVAEGSPVSFVADHPFLFFIVDKENNIVLFAGKVVDPVQ